MRIVTKTNLALAGIVSLSALLNLAVLELTIMPKFLDIETTIATRNQNRAREAIQVQTDQVAAAGRDYAFWDDSYQFVQGADTTYESVNVTPESLKALNVNFFLAITAEGKVHLDKGFDFSGEEARAIRLLDVDELPVGHPFRIANAAPQSRQGLIRTDEGITAVGYAPILTTQREGPAAGTLLFGKVLDLDALRNAVQVDFALLPIEAGSPAETQVIKTDETIENRAVLNGIDGKPLVVLSTTTDRLVSSAGRQAIFAAMILLALGGGLLIVTLGMLLRRIVIARVEALRSHLTDVGTTGSLAPLPPDTHGDELSDTVASFNGMAAQLAELRDRLRRQDYTHGAADQAAGILHNVRNAVSPISTITWDLMKAEDAAMKQNLARALQELGAANLPPERAEKLQQFVRMSAARMLQEGDKRRTELEALNAMVRHVDRILKDEDAVSHGARTSEAITLAPCIAAASTLVHGRPGISFVADVPLNARVIGHKVTLEQVLANLLLNAAEAISAQGGAGTISLEVAEIQHNGTPALDLRIRDDGDGIAADRLDAIFERGFSTRRERSSGVGLHWCANAVNAMGGRLYAESPGPGLGATLHLVLPQDRAEHRSAA